MAGSALSFLFQGQAPTSTTNYGQTSSSVPSWLQQYSQGLLAQSAALASQPYQAYQGPRISPFTPAQTQAQGAVQGLQGQYQPAINQAETLAGNSANPQGIQNGLGMLPQAQSYIQSALSPTAATMNPYTQNVIKKAEDTASQYWQNQLQPSINAQFTAGGNFGSAANQRAQQLGANQITQNIQDTSNSALSQAFQNAQQTGLQAASQQGALGQIAGGLGYEQGTLGLQGAGALGSLATQGQSLGLQGAGALDTIGQEQQQQQQQNLNLGYQDFLNQQQYPYQQAGWMQQMLQGTATPTTVPTVTNKQYTGPTDTSPSPLNQAVGWYNVLGGTPQSQARGGRTRRAQPASALSYLVRRAA